MKGSRFLADIQTDGQTDGQTDWQTDGQTDGRTEGKPIVPSGVNTGRGLITITNYKCTTVVTHTYVNNDETHTFVNNDVMHTDVLHTDVYNDVTHTYVINNKTYTYVINNINNDVTHTAVKNIVTPTDEINAHKQQFTLRTLLYTVFSSRLDALVLLDHVFVFLWHGYYTKVSYVPESTSSCC